MSDQEQSEERGEFASLQQQIKEGSEDREVQTKYILEAIRLGLKAEAMEGVKELKHYDAERIRDQLENGDEDEVMVALVQRRQMWAGLARYLMKRNCLSLWGQVLDAGFEGRSQLIDLVIEEARNSAEPDRVSGAVRAFMVADLVLELLRLLEVLLLTGGPLSSNRNLQNLLLLTAMRANPAAMLDYVQRLNSFDGPDVAEVALSRGFFEEAFAIFHKFDCPQRAIAVLIDHLSPNGDYERAAAYAQKVDHAEAWSKLNQARDKSDH